MGGKVQLSMTNHIFQETRVSVITKHYIHIDILHDHHPTYAKVVMQ